MSFALKSEHALQLDMGTNTAPCPGCGAELDGSSTPLDSIVICARCCTALLWDGTFSCLTEEQVEQLPVADRRRLRSLVAAQRARNAARTLH